MVEAVVPNVPHDCDVGSSAAIVPPPAVTEYEIGTPRITVPRCVASTTEGRQAGGSAVPTVAFTAVHTPLTTVARIVERAALSRLRPSLIPSMTKLRRPQPIPSADL